MDNLAQAGDLAAASLGVILGVRGGEARIAIPVAQAGVATRATVGDFVRIFAGPRRLIGIISEMESQDGAAVAAVARVEVMGEIVAEPGGGAHFRRGVSAYPAIGDAAGVAPLEDLRLIYAGEADSGAIGALRHDESIPARISIGEMLNKHFAVLGSTGVGKSSGMSVILNAVLDTAPNVRIFLLDGHNEFARAEGARANVLNPHNLKLPFWLFNFEEFIEIVFAGRPAAEEEIEILADYIPVAKGMYLSHRAAQSDRYGLRKIDPKRAGFTVDTPVPYMLQDLVGLIDERMGKLENRATRAHCHRLIGRLDTLRNDPRYGFMFENANVGGDTMAEILTNLFRLEPDGKPITVMQLAGLPAEVTDAVVCVLARMAFDFGLWSEGARPLLFACEEAHRFAPADHAAGFAPTRRALMRIAKEGRKYGVYLGLVSQRPAELDPTIISQCNTLFAMRMANERDQALLRSAVTDAVANLIGFVPSLGAREVVAFGEGLPLPTRFSFTKLPPERLPRSETVRLESRDDAHAEHGFVQQVVERWRSAAGAAHAHDEPEPAPAPARPAPAANEADSAAARLEQLRAQLLKRGAGAP